MPTSMPQALDRLLASTDRTMAIAVVLGAVSAYYFTRYVKRWHHDRHPERYRRSVGRYGGRFALSGALILLSAGLLSLAFHLRTWQPFDGAARIGTVTASAKGDQMTLVLKLAGLPERTVTLQGRTWIVRWDLLSFHPWLRAVGLRGYYRVRSVDGLAERTDRIGGGFLSREEIHQASPLHALLAKVPALSFLVRAVSDASPLKPPRGEVEIYAIPGGSAG